eukprot:gb/GEZN01007018.1/.p1 GENE.gb/GEZN01007018.1/~~gb/GEZN01007018.1/.p1  ORF type:complete len:511 (-),score=145.27 gb/GEZN01007018.1/:56-1468(-)
MTGVKEEVREGKQRVYDEGEEEEEAAAQHEPERMNVSWEEQMDIEREGVGEEAEEEVVRAAPNYDLSELRPILRAYADLIEKEEEKLMGLKTLHLATAKLVQYPDQVKYRTLDTRKSALRSRLLPAESVNGALSKYLSWIGFAEAEGKEGLWVLDEETHAQNKRKLERAAVIAKKVWEEHRPSQDELDRRACGKVDLDVRVFDTTKKKTVENTQLGGKDEAYDEETNDFALFVRAAKESKKRNEIENPEMFVMKEKRQELLSYRKRKYGKTVIRVDFDDVIVQFSFNPYEPLQQLLDAIRQYLNKKHVKETFHLLAPPQGRVPVNWYTQTFKATHFVPAGHVIFAFDNDDLARKGSKVLLPSLLKKIRPLEAVEIPKALSSQEEKKNLEEQPVAEMTEEEKKKAKDEAFEAYMKKKALAKKNVGKKIASASKNTASPMSSSATGKHKQAPAASGKNAALAAFEARAGGRR